MNTTSLKPSQIMSLGFMLFAVFFGAGNFIFPPLLGYESGTSSTVALIGFVLSGVGLPLLGIVAVALFNGNIRPLLDRIHPTFGFIFICVLFLSIGPFFAVPRTATVTFTMSVEPFLPAGVGAQWYVLAIVTFVYFLVNYLICLNPTKIVGIVGKVMTPILLVIVGFIIVKAFMAPGGEMQAPVSAYADSAFLKGFTEGFLTMDAIGALVIGGIVISAVKQLGVTNPKSIAKYVMISGVIAAVGLALVYIGLAYLGATSGLGADISNGGFILTHVVSYLFGDLGLVLLGITIAIACLSTSVGLMCACGKYFHGVVPKISYKKWILIFSVFSFGVANLGLSTLVSISLPILKVIYPLVIAVIVFAFLDRYIKEKRGVYVLGVTVTLFVSIMVELNMLGISVPGISALLEKLPFYEQSMGWVLPFIVASVVGYVYSSYMEKARG